MMRLSLKKVKRRFMTRMRRYFPGPPHVSFEEARQFKTRFRIVLAVVGGAITLEHILSDVRRVRAELQIKSKETHIELVKQELVSISYLDEQVKLMKQDEKRS